MRSVPFFMGVLISIASASADASTFQRLPAVGSCSLDVYIPGAASPNNSAWVNYQGGGDAHLMCAIPDTTVFPKAAVTTLYVDTRVNVGGSYVFAKACVQSYDGGQILCGATSQSGTVNGWYSLNLDTAYWRNANYSAWYAYVDVHINNGAQLNGMLAYYP